MQIISSGEVVASKKQYSIVPVQTTGIGCCSYTFTQFRGILDLGELNFVIYFPPSWNTEILPSFNIDCVWIEFLCRIILAMMFLQICNSAGHRNNFEVYNNNAESCEKIYLQYFCCLFTNMFIFTGTLVRSMKGNGAVYVTSTTFSTCRFTTHSHSFYFSRIKTWRNTSCKNPQEAVLSLCLLKKTAVLTVGDTHNYWYKRVFCQWNLSTQCTAAFCNEVHQKEKHLHACETC